MINKSPRDRMVGGKGLVYPIIGFAACVAFIYLSFGDLWVNYQREVKLSFVERNGTHFVVDGQFFYVNGWNSYWFMDHAVSVYSRPRIREMLQAGAKMGLTVCRTWAFNDGSDYNALQISPGKYDEKVFKALDHVIAEARQHGIRLLLCLVNNLQAYGGKTQYVKWAWDEGVGLSSSNDSFFFDPSIRHYFKNYVKTLLTRKNTITGIEYRDDPTIFGWELINEPRCVSDASGDTLQDWIEEMSMFVKSVDKKHLLTVGLEGFYGPKSPKKYSYNPEYWAADLGSDFIRNSMISTVDFASVHIYPDHWFKKKDVAEKLRFVSKWMNSHIEDGEKELMKPVMFTEFGLSDQIKGFKPSQRDEYYKTVFDIVYKSAKENGAGAGSFAWQFFVEGMQEYNDEFGIVPWEGPTIYKLITEHSCRLARLHGPISTQKHHLKKLCSHRR